MANRGLSYHGILLGGVDCLKIPSVCYLHTLSRFSLLVLNLFYLLWFSISEMQICGKQ